MEGAFIYIFQVGKYRKKKEQSYYLTNLGYFILSIYYINKIDTYLTLSMIIIV